MRETEPAAIIRFPTELAQQIQAEPWMQNVAAIMTVIQKPLLPEKIAGYASNEDGAVAAHKVPVSKEQVVVFVQLVQNIEQKNGMHLLEVAPVTSAKQAGDAEVVGKDTIGYRFTPAAQQFFQEKYPDVWREFQKFITLQLMKGMGIPFDGEGVSFGNR